MKDDSIIQKNAAATDLTQYYAEYPAVEKWHLKVEAAKQKFDQTVESGETYSHGQRLANFFNATTEIVLSIIDATNEAGLGPVDRLEYENRVRAFWDTRPKRTLSLGEERAMAVAIAYKDGFRPRAAGAHDTPMEVALLVAALMENLSTDTGPATIRKSIQRFRRKTLGQEFLRFNPVTLKVESVQASEACLGLAPQRLNRRSRGVKIMTK